MATQCVSILEKLTISNDGQEHSHEILCFENEELATKYLSQKYPNSKIKWKFAKVHGTKAFESKDNYTYILTNRPLLNETDLKGE